ncbi:MAG: amidase [Actinomycetota bacterium]
MNLDHLTIPGRPGARVSAFTDDVLGTADAVELAGRVASGDVTSAELVDAAIARAERVNPDLNAVATWDVERAREQASDDTPDGVLGGVPTFIKGLSAYAGLPNRWGSRATPDTPAPEHGPEVEHVLSTGLVSLGLSTAPEFGLTATTESALTGITRNPWSLAHSTGGSSGGSAAMVAAGVVPIAHANDGGGSIRIPAACCGLVGLKPSRGRIASEPLPKVFPVDFPIDGVVSRTVRDTAAFLAGAEQHRPGPGLRPIGDVTGPSERRLRIGVIAQRDDGANHDSVTSSELLRVAALLEELGHEVEVIPSPFPEHLGDDFILMWSMFPTLLWHGGAKLFGEGFDRDRLEPFAQWLVTYFRRRAATAPRRFRRLRKFVDRYPQAYAGHDVLLNPTLGGPLHRIGYLSPDLPGEVHLARVRAHVSTTFIHNAGGGPAVSLPLAQDADGLPMGMQFAAGVGDEATLLALAFELEQAHPWPTLAMSA